YSDQVNPKWMDGIFDVLQQNTVLKNSLWAAHMQKLWGLHLSLCDDVYLCVGSEMPQVFCNSTAVILGPFISGFRFCAEESKCTEITKHLVVLKRVFGSAPSYFNYRIALLEQNVEFVKQHKDDLKNFFS